MKTTTPSEKKLPRSYKGRKPAGESLVWFCSLGLAAGLLMIFGLLGMIAYNGFAVFWPRKIDVIHLSEGSPARIGGNAKIAGEVRYIQENAGARFRGEKDVFEKQVFVGNRDAFGFSFRFVPEKDIQEIERPLNILKVQRLEYGDAIGFPKEFVYPDKTTLKAEDPTFNDRLQKAVAEAGSRRTRIETLEKREIGALNRDMEALRFERAKAGSDAAALDARQAALQQKYDLLAGEARRLREEQKAAHLTIATATDQSIKIEIGNIVKVYAPNSLAFQERVGMVLGNIVAFLLDNPREANTEGGVFPAIFGTFTMTLLMSLAVAPFGVLAALYLREYAKQGFLVRAVRIAVNNLAGVPSIVFGVFGLGFFVYVVGGGIDSLFFSHKLTAEPTFGTGGILWAALTLALMTVPVVIVATEEAVASVPRGMREGSLACGASKWQTIQRIVLPAAVPGIITGLILAMARGAGEVAPLMLVGVVKLAPTLPIDSIFPFAHLDRKFMHLGFHIYDLGFQSPDSEAAKPMVFATTLLLILLVVVLNLSAILIRERLRRRYSTGAF